MKRIFILLLTITAVTRTLAVQPYWVKNPPKSEYPNEYKYAVAVGTGRSENEARLNAEEQMTEQVFYAHGCQNRYEIEYWQADGFRVRTEQGISYVMRDEEGTFHYYLLYIYATKPKFYKQEHWECSKKGKEKSDLASFKTPNTKPSYWTNYDDSENYFSIQKMHSMRKGQMVESVVDSVYALALQMLKEKYKDYGAEALFPALVCNDYFYDRKKKEVHTISYVRKNSLKNVYSSIISEYLAVTIDNEIKDAQSFERTEDWEVATAMYNKAQEQCDDAARSLEQFKRIAGENPLIMYYTNEINQVRDVIRKGLSDLRKKAAPDREKRLMDMLDIAQKAEKERKLGTVLKYYYGALAYSKRYPQLETMSINYDYNALGRPWGLNHPNASTKHTLKVWLLEHIRTILKSIQVQCYQDESDAYKMNFVFLWPDQSPVTDGDFCFNLNKGEGWSWLYSIADGEGEIEKRDCPMQFDIRFEYKYIEHWHSDEVIRNEVKDAIFDFAPAATHHVVVRGKRPAQPTATNNVAVYPMTTQKTSSIHSGNPIKEIPVSEEKVYKEVIAKVCDAIHTKDYASIQNYCTPKGYNMFMNFVNEGKVTVKNTTRCRLLSCWDEVYARSIKMTIQFRSKKEIMTKNVVFVFNKNKKIDGIQFAIDEVTRQDINSQEEWDEGMKYAVLNFIENYQTAYNLKRLDYIESVFSDDAIIIVGQVLPEKAEMSDKRGINFKDAKSQKVKYYNLSKDEYLNRLRRIFKTNEWISINFANVDISQHPDSEVKRVYGLGMKQDYSSQHYGDTGYLFLVVDMNDQQKPIIHLRVWTPEAEFGWPQYIQLLKDEQNK